MKLALGGAQFGMKYGISNRLERISRATACDILKLARQATVDTIDTAITYGDSEALFGDIGVDDFKVITKLPIMPDQISDPGEWVRDQIIGSLTRLGLAQLHGVLFHCADQLVGSRGQELARALEWAKRDGLVAQIGVSIYAPETLTTIMKTLRPDIVQAPLNLIDRRLEKSGWLQRLYDSGVKVHARSVFLQGLLLMDRADMAPYFARWNGLWCKWRNWLESEDVSATIACLSYPLSLYQVDRVVVGVSSKNEFQSLLSDATLINKVSSFPNIVSTDKDLISPDRWSLLKS